jgi:CheY-like chemotaxis protein
MRLLLAEALRGLGLRHVDEASTAADALDRVMTGIVDMVFADIELGDGPDGLAFTRHVRALPQLRVAMTPILIVSAHATLPRVIQARDAGANGFLAKPITAGGVAEWLADLIRSERMFVRTDTYFGPDRRHGGDAAEGPFRRSGDYVTLDS